MAVTTETRKVVGASTTARRTLAALGLILSCTALALGGLWLGLRLSTPGTYGSALGTASFQVKTSEHGGLEVFIPLTDWGVRAHAFSAPIRLHVEPRVLNRQALIAAAQGNSALLTQTAKDLSRDGRLALERAARFLLLGTLIAAAFGWALLRIYHCSNRRLLIAVPACTMLIGLMVGGSVLWRVGATWNTYALSHPTYYARGAELIQLLDAAEKAGKAKDSYASKVQGALSGFASLLTNPDAGSVTGDRRALLVSDLHNNTLALSSLSYYAQGQPVFFDGDFGNTGNAQEVRTLVPAIAKLGSRVIAVSGDHDSHAMMLALARHGVTVLSSQGQLLANGTYGRPEVEVDGLRVAGFDDPMEYYGPNPDDPHRVFSFAQLPDPERALADAQHRLLTWFESLPQRPDIVEVHENGLAQYLARALDQAGYKRPLTILTGHDHLQHVNHDGPIDVVDAGTVGASGLYGIGADYVGLGDLHWMAGDPVLEAADLIQIEPVSGVAQAQRVVLSPDCSLSHTHCASAVDYLDPREGPKTNAIHGARPISPLAPIAGARVP
ncbi:MAG TPA: metallophosphoesterase family protein [Solirubrobacteraceae bacterium]|nr:metallophosphoesterase family protein [Solirubrobacteraceae bacterium]